MSYCGAPRPDSSTFLLWNEAAMDLPDESQWDETTCKLALCQHPQCWATIRRIERGHPRILRPPCKTAPNNEDKLPVLTIVNISAPCFPAKRLARGHLSGFTFSKAPSLLCQRSKFDSKFQGRPRKDLPDKDLTRSTDRSPEGNHRIKKLSVLNLNETQLPSPQDVRNMVVIWVPGQPVKHVSLLPDEGKTVLSLETKTQLAMTKKKLPLEKSRPDSAILAKMFLSVHRLTLQRPALKYPEHLKKLCSNLNTEGRFSSALRSSGHKEQRQQKRQQKQQQRMVKIPPKRQEAKKKPKSDPGSPDILHKDSGHRTLLGWKSDKKQLQRMKSEEPTLRQDSTERPQMENDLDSFPSKDDPELSKTKPSNKDISAQEDVVLESQERSPEDLSDGTSITSWNPELKLLRILQATDDEDEENQLSTLEGEGSFKTSQGSLTPE
uniref:Chromosome 9 open reading frame 43 n=1 Tax=Suricata suricatta TaxID=37032 RepID=A0A673UUM6_SURSU